MLLFALLACSDGSSSTDDSSSMDSSPGIDEGPPDMVPELPISECVAEPYSWLNVQGMGRLLEVEEDGDLRLSADDINVLLLALGYGAIAPVEYGVRIFKVRYLTQERGQEIEVTGLVSLPDVFDPETFPLLLWNHFTYGFQDECAPSNQGIEGAAFPMLMASQGFVVAAPDYIGMAGWGEPSGRLHPWMIAEPTAVAALDSLRATLELIEQQELDAQADPQQLVHWGGSEGGFASLWTDLYQPHYAPEFTSVATVAAVPVTDVQALAQRGVETVSDTTGGLTALTVALWDWTGRQDALDRWFQPGLGESLLETMETTCGEIGPLEGTSSIEELFADDYVEGLLSSDWEAIDPLGCGMRESSLRQTGIERIVDVPLLLVTGEDDDLAYAPPVHEDIPRLCEQGYTIQHIQCAGAEHTEAAVNTLLDQLAWIRARLDGEPLEGEQCVVADPSDCSLE